MITMTIMATILLRSKNRAIITVEVAEIIEDEAKIEVEFQSKLLFRTQVETKATI